MKVGSHSLPIMEGILPIEKKRIPAEVVAGITLAALAIPEVMGYATIAGMPVVTGLYTLVLPCWCSHSRFVAPPRGRGRLCDGRGDGGGAGRDGGDRLVRVRRPRRDAGADGGCAAIVARLIKLGFIADFLSRTVLIGFLTGVGIQVAIGQLAGMIGVPTPQGGSCEKLWDT